MSDKTSDKINEPAGRRPLKTRGWRFFQNIAARLASAGITPNAISMSSVVFATAAGITLAATDMVEDHFTRQALWLASGVLIQLRLIANLLDGMVAIEGGKASAVGEIYNEVPDRISDSAILIGAGYAFGGDTTLGLMAALVAVFVAYVRAFGASVGAGQVFVGPCAKPQRMAIMTLLCVVSALLPQKFYGSPDAIRLAEGTLGLIVVGGVVTAIRRLRTIANVMREQHASIES